MSPDAREAGPSRPVPRPLRAGKPLALAAALVAASATGHADAQSCATNRDGREVFLPCPMGMAAGAAATWSTGALRPSAPDAAGYVDMVDPATGRVVYSVMPPGSCVVRAVDGRAVCSATGP